MIRLNTRERLLSTDEEDYRHAPNLLQWNRPPLSSQSGTHEEDEGVSCHYVFVRCVRICQGIIAMLIRSDVWVLPATGDSLVITAHLVFHCKNGKFWIGFGET